MDSLTAAIQRCQLSLKLDNETEGQGNCFPNSIVQQCRRPEVREWLKQNNPPALFSGQQWIRKKVTNFALNTKEGNPKYVFKVAHSVAGLCVKIRMM